jgi:hypothetical protein
METDQNAYETFWYFINERHRIYIKTTAGEPKPWTDDPILQRFKFCNVHRRLDKTSAWMIENLIAPHCSDGALLLFNLLAYRTFNRISTGRLLGWIAEWEPEKVALRLQEVQARGEPIFGAAYRIRQGPGDRSKIESYVKVLSQIWTDRQALYDKIKRGGLQDAVELFDRYPLIGPFIAYQFALDLTYSLILPAPKDLNTWAEVGPGAAGGLRRIWPTVHNGELLSRMRLLRDEAPRYLEPHVGELNLQDIEFCLCEVNKYLRTRRGEGRPKEKYSGGG